MSNTQFRITPASPEALHSLEDTVPPELKEHFDLIKGGLEAIPGVPAEAFYSAVTLRTLALKPDIFKSWFLTEYHSAKQGEVPSSHKELLATLVSLEIEEDETPACGPYHIGAARFEGADEDTIRGVTDFRTNRDQLPEELRVFLEFGLKAATKPKEVTDADVERIRGYGYSDEALVEIVSTALIAYNLASLNQVFNLEEGAG